MCYSVQLEFCLAGVGEAGLSFLQKLFIYVMLRLHTEFQCSTIAGTGQKVCGGGWVVVVLKPIIVLTLAKAEQK